MMKVRREKLCWRQGQLLTDTLTVEGGILDWKFTTSFPLNSHSVAPANMLEPRLFAVRLRFIWFISFPFKESAFKDVGAMACGPTRDAAVRCKHSSDVVCNAQRGTPQLNGKKNEMIFEG